MPHQPDARRLLEIDVCRDLGRPTPGGPARPEPSGPAAARRYRMIHDGVIGRAALLDLIGWCRRVLDADLVAPAAWRGPGRRALRQGRPENTPWVEEAFAVVAGAAPSGPIRAAVLLRWNAIVGGPGQWRERTMWVDGFRVPHPPGRARELVDHHLARAGRGDEPAPLAAARLHLGILLAHPFGDGNGRTARTAAATLLLRDGYRSSLLTCVEQHHHVRPDAYPHGLARLRLGSIGADRMIDQLLGAMAARAVLAAWIRRRHDLLLERARAGGCADPHEVVRRFEFADDASPLDHHGGDDGARADRWHRLRPRLDPAIAAELRSQLARAAGDG